MGQSIIFSGIQPSGNLHVGNYLGALRSIIDIQNTNDAPLYYFIADLHTLTSTMSPDARREQIVVAAAELIALGIDPERTVLFVQSQVPEHTELAWIFSSLTPLSELERMTQFKDKSQKQEKNINAALLNYPILQAADILLYKGTTVPVGQDQVQHVELTRDCARWFNNRYGEYFPEVKALLTEVPKVMGLLEPTKKMSKSDGVDNVLYLADEPEMVKNKLKRAVTATEGGAEMPPGVANLLLLLKFFGAAGESERLIEAQKAGTIRYSELKETLTEAFATSFQSFRHKRSELLANRDYLTATLQAGADKARRVAETTMHDVRALVGLR